MTGRAARTVAAAAVLAGLAVPVVRAAGPAPLDQARHAAEHIAFEGVLQVQWREGDATRSERLRVEAAGGSLMVRGANLVMAQPELGRMVSHGGGGWQEMWLPSLERGTRPDSMTKYRSTGPVDGPRVAGRTTKVMEVHEGGKLLERIYLDAQTNLLLARDQFDGSGELVRRLAFESLELDPSSPAPTPPKSPELRAPEAVDPEALPSSAPAPEALADGYQRMGVYRNGPVLHVLYSDGLYDLSLFEQDGRLRRSDLPPSGQRVDLGEATGWRYPWPGGQLVVWSSGGKVFTAVSDAPADQVVAAVRSLPRVPERELSLLGKIRRACQALMEPLA